MAIALKKKDCHQYQKKKRVEIIKKCDIFIPKDARVCFNHIENGTWDDFVPEHSDYTQNQMEDMISLLQSEYNIHNTKQN